jgi:hypothetical protein
LPEPQSHRNNRGEQRTLTVSLCQRRDSAYAVFAILVVVLGFHLFAIYWINHFYALNLPHYDSVGTLTFAYRVLDAFNRGGYAGAFGFLGSQPASVALSATQAAFAAIFAPILSPTPSSIQLYNALAVAAAVSGMFIFARSVGASIAGATTFAIVFFLPDGLWWWDFGLLDYRRDAGMLGFLTCTIFLLLGLHLGSFEKRSRLALATGAAAGLTLVSRDSSLIYVVGFIAAPTLALMALQWRVEGLRSAIFRLLWIVAGALTFLLFWIYWLGTTIGRLGDSLIAFGAGGDKWDSLAAGLRTSTRLLAGNDIAHLLALPATYVVGAVLIAAIMPAIVLAPRRSLVLPVSRPTATLVLLATAAWMFAWLQFVLAFVVGWRGNQAFSVHAPPYLPGLVSAYLVAAVAPLWLTIKLNRLRPAVLGVIGASVLLVAQLSVANKMQYTPTEIRKANVGLAALTAASPGPPVFAELWFEILKVPVLAYTAAQQGRPLPQRVRFLYRGKAYDSVVAIPPDEASRAEVIDLLDNAVRCTADYIIVTTNLARYENAHSPLLLFRYGRTMVERILGDLQGRAALTVEVPHNDQVTVLDNRDRKACKQKPARE